MQVTNPQYVSQQMFDMVLRGKFHENPDDGAVIAQGSKIIQLVTNSMLRDQILTDILHAAGSTGRTSTEQLALVAFGMGVQLGFELGITFPPLG